MTEDTKEVLISPVTTAPGVLSGRGMIKVGTRLADLPVELFSSNWMKAVTKVDQQRVAAYQNAKKKAKAEGEGPTVSDCMAEISTLKEQLASANGKIGALTQKIEALSTAKPAAKPKPKAPEKPAEAMNKTGE